VNVFEISSELTYCLQYYNFHCNLTRKMSLIISPEPGPISTRFTEFKDSTADGYY